MTHAQLLEEIKQLPPEDKRALLDEILQIVRDETRPSGKPVVEQLRGIAKPDRATRAESEDSHKGHLSLSQRLYGILKFDGDPPNDGELNDMISDCLIRKYS